jgi:hypothetical protein
MHAGANRVALVSEQEYYEPCRHHSAFHSPQQRESVRAWHGRDRFPAKEVLPLWLGAGHLATPLQHDRHSAQPSSARKHATPADCDRPLGSFAASRGQLSHAPQPSPIGSAGLFFSIVCVSVILTPLRLTDAVFVSLFQAIPTAHAFVWVR